MQQYFKLSDFLSGNFVRYNFKYNIHFNECISLFYDFPQCRIYTHFLGNSTLWSTADWYRHKESIRIFTVQTKGNDNVV